MKRTICDGCGKPILRNYAEKPYVATYAGIWVRAEVISDNGSRSDVCRDCLGKAIVFGDEIGSLADDKRPIADEALASASPSNEPLRGVRAPAVGSNGAAASASALASDSARRLRESVRSPAGQPRRTSTAPAVG